MRNSSLDSLTKAEWVTTDKVSTLTVWVIQCVEEEWGRGAQKVFNVLF